MTGRFQPGDQLHVRRPLGYFHHGIYISDDRVIQFGGGLPLLHKDSTFVDAVTLDAFESGGTATVVRHGYESPFTGWHPAADEPWKIIERVEFLLKLQPELPYNLIGHNCEHMATLCAVDRWAESYQVRRGFAAKAAFSGGAPDNHQHPAPQELACPRLAAGDRSGQHRRGPRGQGDLQPRDQETLERDQRRLVRVRAHARRRSAQQSATG